MAVDLMRSKLLVECGFIKEDRKGNYVKNEKTGLFEPISGNKLDGGDALEESREILKGKYGNTGYPKPHKFYNLSWEVYDLSLEEPYFWVLDTLKDNFPIVDKLEDAFAASENSAFFGVTQQRLGAQQDRISQFLATIGRMIKELFQIVRELRIIDERLKYYRGVQAELAKPLHQRSHGDEITLKGFFVDLVQGGGKSAASVYGMARELEFITLPDLFFDAPAFKTQEELEAHIRDLEKSFNRNVLRVLLRHLTQYVEWRKRTHAEHENRRKFQLAYLRQHFDIIKMYVNWIKPYLRHVSRLHFKDSRMSSADLVSSFEGSMLDIELLAREEEKVGARKANGCILATFNYRTRPELKVVQEGYQRGPVHIGRFEMTLRVYAWTDEEVDNYKRLKDKEAMYLMSEISKSVEEAMASLGSELDRYYKESIGEKSEESAQAKPQAKKTVMQKLFGDFYTPKQQKQKTVSAKKLRAEDAAVRKKAKALAIGAGFSCWNTYHNFKKAHRMIAW